MTRRAARATSRARSRRRRGTTSSRRRCSWRASCRSGAAARPHQQGTAARKAGAEPGTAAWFCLGVRPLNSAISIELYYIFATIWGHKLYTLYGILLIVFGILTIVTSFITVALTYFQLSVENYHWWWRSIVNGGCGVALARGRRCADECSPRVACAALPVLGCV